MKPLPKISIIVPSYNMEKYIGETLDSVVSQKYPNLEIIVQDGGSTDGTVGIIKEFAKKHPKIINWVSKKDKGQLDTINKGFRKATGDILTYINADDVYKKNALLTVGKYFVRNSKTFWLAGKGDVIDENSKKFSTLITKYKDFLLSINHYSLLLMVNYLTQPAVFLTKEAYQKYGPFKGTKKFIMEYDLWLRIGKQEMPTIINDYLASFRLTTGNISATQFKDVLSQDFRVVRKYTNNFFILLLHRLHNWGRVLIVKFLKKP